MAIKSQDDISFKCPACHGSLVADVKCAGISLSCPHCLKWIQVPFPEGYDFEGDIHAPTATEAVKGVLENELETTRQKLRKSRADVTALEAELKTVRSQAEPIRAALEAATKRVAEGREETAKAQAELAGAITARDEAEVNRVVAEKASAETAQLKSENAALQTALATVSESLETANRAAEEAQTARQRESERNAGLQHELDEAQKRYKTVLSTMQGELDALRAKTTEEFAALRDELSAAITARDDAEVGRVIAEKAASEAAQMKAKLATAEAAVAHIHEQFEAANLAREEVDAALQAERESSAALQRESGEAQKRYKSIVAAKQDEVDALQAKAAELSAELEAQRLSPAQRGLEEATARLQQLEARLTTLQNERTALLSTRQDQAHIIEQLYEERSGVARELQHAEDLRGTFENHIRTLEKTVEDLNASLSAAQAARQEGSDRLAAEASEHTKTRQELDAFRAAQDQHLADHHNLRAAFASLEQPLEEIRRALGNQAGQATRVNSTPVAE